MSPAVEGRSARVARGRGTAGARRRTITRGATRSFASLAALIGVTVGLTACGPKPKGSYPEDDPRSAVSQLLRATVGQANGQRACALLTAAAREQFDQTPAGSCRNALNTAIAALPGAATGFGGTDREAEDIDLEAQTDGDRATVTASRGDGPRLTFEVVRLSEEELAADPGTSDNGVGSAPQSDWRVDRGAEQLVSRKSSGDASDSDAGSETDAQR